MRKEWGGRCGRWLSDMSLEASWMTLLTLLNKTESMWNTRSHPPDLYIHDPRQPCDVVTLTWRRVSILRLNFEIFLFLVSEERAVPSIRTASIDCFHLLPSLLLALVCPLLLLSRALFLSFSLESFRWWRLRLPGWTSLEVKLHRSPASAAADKIW